MINLALDEDELRSVVTVRLTRDELDHAVAYAADKPVEAGAVIDHPKLVLTSPWQAVLSSIHREPLTNWGHSSRYLLMHRGADEEMSVEARFPPFGSEVQLNWRVVYRAPGIPVTGLGEARS